MTRTVTLTQDEAAVLVQLIDQAERTPLAMNEAMQGAYEKLTAGADMTPAAARFEAMGERLDADVARMRGEDPEDWAPCPGCGADVARNDPHQPDCALEPSEAPTIEQQIVDLQAKARQEVQ